MVSRQSFFGKRRIDPSTTLRFAQGDKGSEKEGQILRCAQNDKIIDFSTRLCLGRNDRGNVEYRISNNEVTKYENPVSSIQ